ncbi:MAG TPA: choice-of-anchor D domain-containing protein [Candidatus Acidoferrum sp.]
MFAQFKVLAAVHEMLAAHGVHTNLVFLAFAFVLVGCAGNAAPTAKALVESAGVVVKPGSFDFKTVTVGQTITQTMQIQNTNKKAVQISALSVSNKQFTISGPSVPRTILPGMSAQYTVAFTPTASGNSTGAISITDDSGPAPLAVTVAGAGAKAAAAALQVSPTSISFGNLNLQTSSTQNVTLQNTGDVSVSINGVSVAGAGFGYSDLSPGYSLSPNQKVTFQVWFKPQVKGPASGTLSVLAASLTSPVVANLSGVGVTPGTNPAPTPTPSPTPKSHAVHLSWNASTSSIVGYRLYRSDVAGGPYNSVNGSNIEALSFEDTAVSAGTTYYYVVTAVNSSGEESIYSNQTAAAIPTP